jgi:prohibitin 2
MIKANSEPPLPPIRIPFIRRGIFVYPVAAVVVAGFIVLALWRSIFVLVLPGEIGVLYDPTAGGTQTARVYGEGVALKFPWSRFYTYDTRLQNSRHDMRALSAEGMQITVELSVLYRPIAQTMGRLHQELGPEYRERVIAPIVISTVREVFSRHNSHELYTQDFQILQDEIATRLESTPVSAMIDFTAVLISRLDLPPMVLAAIERKLEQEQIADSYQFVLAAQRAEAERLRIEALGIQNFYAIVSSALTEPLLTWRGIEATVQLAQSQNAKIVVIGSGSDQLPIILGGEIGQLPAGPPAPVAPLPGDAFPLGLSPAMPDLGSIGPSLSPSPPPGSPAPEQMPPALTPVTSADPADGSDVTTRNGVGDFTLIPGEERLPPPGQIDRN